MRGFLYKQLRQNRIIILICAVIPTLMTFPMLGMSYMGEDDISTLEAFFSGIAEGSTFRIAWFIFGYVISGMILTATYSSDELKKWVYFCAATPKGGKGLVRSKYVMILISGLFTFAVSAGCDTVMCAAAEEVTGEKMKSAYVLLLALFFIHLIAAAVELPFTLRFGEKAGNVVKVAMLFGLLFIVIVYLLFGPIPDSFAGGVESFALLMEDIAGGDVPSWIIPTIAVVSLAAFSVSCVISERGLLKGTETYNK